MEIRDWDKFLIPYEQAVEELKVKFRSIRSELRKKDEYSPIEFVTGRVKKVSSILEKARKLQVPMDQLETGIEDIAGIRIMCQFVEDIQKMVEMIHQRNGKDLIIVYEKDYVSNQKESGYRSYHIIINYPVQTAEGERWILAEIQIRTLAMNFWATIEHSLNYKYRKNIPEKVRSRLKKAAEAAYLLDQEMSEIREEIKEAQKLFEIKSQLVSNILQSIHQLYRQGHVSEASFFQERFNQLWEMGDIHELRRLRDEMNGKLNSMNGDS
ncbi:GTP pyrophosphokinase family protein [Microaerobacter geothermalis]|uniref:GTP pyrophosphokinase n=1 Tax=Microaerobacter geothermalis TaxID=674972 RepID=UPI001F2D7EEF|nr:GTP pyrophosphokinase family protein [Microaerobacter geothermalis]MCF6093927.1 GTP pyrophosphokinase family protein [Microaerobacter geothermalis]